MCQRLFNIARILQTTALKVLEVAETYRFHHTAQSETENVAEYANILSEDRTFDQESQRQTDPKSKMVGKQCFRCGSPQHLADKCSHVESTYNYFGKPGHLAKAFFKKKKEFGGNNTTHQVTATPTSLRVSRRSKRIQSLLVQFT